MRRITTIAMGVATVALVLAPVVLPSSAEAATIQSRPYISSFDGSSGPLGAFGETGDIAVGPDGSVYVIDRSKAIVAKFDASGNPVNFAALGTPVLDGSNTPNFSFNFIDSVTVDGFGRIYVGHIFGEIFVFNASGQYLFQITESETPFESLGSSVAMATDSVGGLYVSGRQMRYQGEETNAVVKFRIEENTAFYDSTIVDFEGRSKDVSALVTDTADNLYLLERGSAQVWKFNPEGEKVATLDLGVDSLGLDRATGHLLARKFETGPALAEYTTSGDIVVPQFGAHTIVTRVAVSPMASGGPGERLFVSDTDAGRVHVFGPLSPVTVPDLSVEPADNVGFFGARLHGLVNPAGVHSAYHFEYRRPGERWGRVTNDQDVGDGSSDLIVSADVTKLTHSSTYEFRLVGTAVDTDSQNISGVQSFTTLTVPPPAVSIEPPTSVTSSSAHFEGSVNPVGRTARWRFEYSTNQVSWTPLPGPDGAIFPLDDAGDGTDDVIVVEDAENLQPNTKYYVRLRVENDLGDPALAEEQFETEPAAPLLLPGPAPVTAPRSATLFAEFIPGAPETTYHFEYGLTTAYGESIPQPHGDGGSGGGSVRGSATISGLAPATTYHYRVVAENDEGVRVSGDRTFTTRLLSPPKGLPDGRVYERVSPQDKNGAEVLAGNAGRSFFTGILQVAKSGEAAAWSSAGNFDGEGGATFSQYLSRRQADGWRTEGLNPKQESPPNNSADLGFNRYTWFSDELDAAAPYTFAQLNPTDPPERVNLYLRDNKTRSYQLLNIHGLSTPPDTYGGGIVLGASADNSHVLFESGNDLLPDAGVAYEWHDGQLRAIGLIPEGGSRIEANFGTGGPAHAYSVGENYISEDGRRVFFHTRPALYAAANGATIELISGSERSGDNPATPRQAMFLSAEASTGSDVFFTSPIKLVDGATASGGSPDLYRWSADAPDGEQLTDLTTTDPTGGGAVGFDEGIDPLVGTSRDHDTIYFVSEASLAPGAVRGRRNLYVWKEGAGLRFIAGPVNCCHHSLSPGFGDTSYENYRDARVSEDGRYVAFVSRASLTDYDTQGTRQIYLFDARTTEIACVSCNRRTRWPIEHSYFSALAIESVPIQASRMLARNLSSNGEVFFETRQALSPNDTNGKIDVYEWSNGEARLISTGQSGQISTFAGAGEDGKNVFIVTAEQLARSDADVLFDLYDARVGGRVEPVPPPGCVGDECQGVPSAPPPFPEPGTADLSGGRSISDGASRKCERIARRANQARQVLRALRRRAAARVPRTDARDLKTQIKALENRAEVLSGAARSCRRTGADEGRGSHGS